MPYNPRTITRIGLELGKIYDISSNEPAVYGHYVKW